MSAFICDHLNERYFKVRVGETQLKKKKCMSRSIQLKIKINKIENIFAGTYIAMSV